MFTDPSSKTKTDVAETATVRKFMFDRSFDNALVVHRAAEPKPVVLSQEQVDALKKEAFDSGFAEGKIAGHDAQTAQLELVLIKIGDVIDTLSKRVCWFWRLQKKFFPISRGATALARSNPC